MTLLLGADVGGTATRVILEQNGTIVGRATGRAAAIRPGRAMTSAAVIAETVRRAHAEARVLRSDVLVVGAAGAGREAERMELARALRHEGIAERIIVTTDVAIALTAAYGTGPGVVLVAGTGSIAFGRLPDGSEIRRGGYGWQVGDEGGGYWIGRAALRAIGRAEDGRGSATSLTAAVLAVTRAPSFEDLIRWSANAGPPEVAALTPIVLAEAHGGDTVAREILDDAAAELAVLATSLVDVFPAGDPVPLALAGGLVEASDRETPNLRERVLVALADLKHAQLREEPVEPVLGALQMAREA